MSNQTPELKFVGGALMAVGGLIAALCGTCTVVWFGAMMIDAFRASVGVGNVLGLVALTAVVGGLPTLLGVLLARWGWRIYRPRPRVRARDLASFSDGPEDTA